MERKLIIFASLARKSWLPQIFCNILGTLSIPLLKKILAC